jgi:site-specific DNA-adenine methylase
MPEFPVEMDNYVEPFWAGVLLLLTYVKEGIIKVRGIYAYDLNEPLIHVYKNIQTSHVELYDAVQIVAELGSCGNGDVNRNQQP